MKHSLSTTYALIWQLKNQPHYQFTQKGVCINTKTGRKIKKTLCGGSAGYCINGKFKSVTALRKQLRKVQLVKCPF